MYTENGPPLFLDQQLRVVFKLQVLFIVFDLRTLDVCTRGVNDGRICFSVMGRELGLSGNIYLVYHTK